MASIGLGKIGLSDDDELSTINVRDFGAIGDGTTDDSQAFLKAWKKACGIQAGYVNFIIESGKAFLLKPIRFEGPCRASYINIQVLGTITAPKSIYEWGGQSVDNWLIFFRINGLIVNGKGTINGQGSIWWQQLPKNNLFHPLDGVSNKGPDALSFVGCNNLKLDHLNLINSPRRHVVIFNINGATISNLNIIAPKESPNTDGIDIGQSTNIQLHYCNIKTGDDCIAIGPSSFYINISNIACGPGHGISIGSLGLNGRTDKVEEVQVRDCTFTGTRNGVRIKTWEGGSGYARKILFEGITLNAADNPIIIDQYYCPNNMCSKQSTSGVKLSDISFTRVIGTTTTKNAINLSCSKSVACTNILLNHVNIKSAYSEDVVSSYCINAHGRFSDSVPPVDCLLN
ncbi:hypothetical protein VitviT2T_013626 [Vitis vinifera]|uniref:Polygalacturonase n=1 Tax=Vitis vinifera TaxID=29760 RepID=A0ABY9CH86_VITVI|nr:hypothetical protein VitviT2T_013626 [Vitis vinifera]